VKSSPLALLTLARLREFWREPSAVFWTFVFPIILAVALGLAFRNQKPTPPTVAVVEGPGARGLAQSLSGQGLAAVIVDENAALHRLRTNKVVLVLRQDASGALIYRYDPAQPEALDTRLKADDALQRADGRRDPRQTHDDLVTTSGARYIDWLIPGLVGMQLMSGSLWGIAFGLAQTRQKKLLKRLIATPMTRLDYLSSLVASRLIFVILELPVLLGFGWLAFGVRVHGSLLGVLFLSLLGAASFAGLALLCGCRAGNQETASGLVNLAQLPMLLVSGVFFSSARFPESLQGAIRLLPLTAMNDSLRALINDGAPLSSVSFEIAVMAVWGLLCGALALRLFRWT
jgi:ABC-2 type transport system permease protein